MKRAADLVQKIPLGEIASWFDDELGQELLSYERRILDRLLGGLYGVHLLQVGVNPLTSLANACSIPHQFVMHPEWVLGMDVQSIIAHADEIPLNKNTVDVVLLHHALDFLSYPHQVVREAARVVRPGGHIVIVGFNPHSLWGVMRWQACRQANDSWRQAHFISLRRLQDWAQLLGLTEVRILTDYYQPPYTHSAWRERFSRFNRIGRRSLPHWGAFYAMLVRKDVVGMTPLTQARRARHFIQLPVPEPATRGQMSETR